MAAGVDNANQKPVGSRTFAGLSMKAIRLWSVRDVQTEECLLPEHVLHTLHSANTHGCTGTPVGRKVDGVGLDVGDCVGEGVGGNVGAGVGAEIGLDGDEGVGESEAVGAGEGGGVTDNGVAVDGIVVEGTAVDGVGVDGVDVEGVAVDGTPHTSTSQRVRKLVPCNWIVTTCPILLAQLTVLTETAVPIVPHSCVSTLTSCTEAPI